MALLSLSLAIVLSAAATAMTFMAYSNLRHNQLQNEVIGNVEIIRDTLVMVFANRTNFPDMGSNVNEERFYEFLPASMRVGATGLQHALGGHFSLEDLHHNCSSCSNMMRLGLYDLDAETCAKVIFKDFGGNQVRVSVDFNNLVTRPTTYKDALTRCKGVSDSKRKVGIYFVK